MSQYERLVASTDDGPRRIGRYLLLGSLGEGGMSLVHRARAFAAAGVTKDVCVKRIRRERLSRRGAVDRFVEEARVSMSLAHGNIVPVFDFGRAGGEYFLAMEWIDGADLKVLLADARDRGEPIGPLVVAHVGAEVARALAYAHDRPHPVIHRDVKPANVLVSRAGDVKLADFGLATIVGSADGSHGGTAGYMAPEVRGEGGAGARSDLYSLGITLCEMLTGERSIDALRVVDRPETAELRNVIEQLTSEDPGARPESARSVASELERIVGAARAAGAPAPRDSLSRLAERVASGMLDRSAPAPLDVDASFVRDGSLDDFADRMGATSATVSAGEAAGPGESARSSKRRVAGVAALVIALVAGAIAVSIEVTPATERPQPGREGRAGAAASGSAANDVATSVPAPTTVVPAHPVAPEPVTDTPPVEPESDRRTAAAPGTDRDEPARRARAGEARSVATSAAPPAILNVNALPWAEVRIDDRSLGVTPLFGIELSPGTHTLYLSNAPLGRERESRIELAPGDRRDLVIDLRQ